MRIAVVIPTLNEELRIARAIDSARREGADEIVVADGGSDDRTARIAAERALVVRGVRGRGAQQNAGARAAAGDVFLFLHADSTLPAGAVEAIRRELRGPRVAGGTFSLRFGDRHPLLRVYAWFTHFRPLLLHYGDQGIFVRREVFERMGGFSEIPLMEDVDFLRRLEHEGARVVIDLPVTTSSRRFRENGIVRQQLLNVTLVGLFRLGVKAETLVSWYRERERTSPQGSAPAQAQPRCAEDEAEQGMGERHRDQARPLDHHRVGPGEHQREHHRIRTEPVGERGEERPSR